MKKISLTLLACVLSMSVGAQTLNVKVGAVNYQFPASKTGNMIYENGNKLTIMDKVFTLSDLKNMTVNSNDGDDVVVKVSYENEPTGKVYIQTAQTATDELGYDKESNKPLVQTSLGGIRLNFQTAGIDHVEIESVDGFPLAGDHDQSILTFYAPDGGTFEPGKDYIVTTFPCDVSSGYRLSIYKDGLVAPYFGVHQTIEAGDFISPLDLDESELEFDEPDAPLVEEERPELDNKTKELLREYKKNPCLETYNALYEQMGVRYDKVVARKKAKLRELEREAHTQNLIDEMQGIVDEMVNNREERLQQRFLSLIDSRTDDNPDDEWLVLKGATEGNAYIGYAPVTNEEYAAFDVNFTYAEGQERYPVVNVSYDDAMAYCTWLGSKDDKHAYRLPSEYEWILAAGHMPKDVNMNANFVESGLTSVDAYAGSKGNCGGIDFWGNSWEWTSSLNDVGLYIVKGGSWDSSRDACRSEYSEDARDGTGKYANVGFRVVRADK